MIALKNSVIKNIALQIKIEKRMKNKYKQKFEKKAHYC